MRVLLGLASLAALAAAASAGDIAPRLRSLGYRAAEIARMKPTVASIVARRGLPRPRDGLPANWIDDRADEDARRPGGI